MANRVDGIVSATPAAQRQSIRWRISFALVSSVLLILGIWKTERSSHSVAHLNSILLAPEHNTLPMGLTRQYTAVGNYSDGSIRDLGSASWTSSNSSVLKIDKTGMVTPVGVGAATIHVTSGPIEGAIQVTVTPPALVGLAISETSLSLTPGKTVQLELVGSQSDGVREHLTNRVTWISSDPSAVTVTPSGLVRTRKTGQSIIRAAYGTLTTAAFVTVTSNANGFAGVLTSRYDNTRVAENRNETILTPSNVNARKFGKKFADSVDGFLNAQPLYVPNILVPGRGAHNLVYVATENNSVYAFDADSAGAPIWTANFGPPAPHWDLPCKDYGPSVGITGTPVIDPDTKTLYVVARTIRGRTNYSHLHALDITTGAEKFGGPVQISATVPGTAEGSQQGQITFDPLLELQRPGLALANGKVYVAFGSLCDFSVFHGWLIAYDAKTLSQTDVFLTTPNGRHGGIWQTGAAPSVDFEGNLFVVTADGEFDANVNGSDYGASVLKFSTKSSRLYPTDYFAPFDQDKLADNLDLGVGGALLLPDQVGLHPHLVLTAGKDGTVYLIDRDNMGHTKSGSDNQIVQSITQAFHHRIHSSAGFWKGDSGSWIYLGAVKESLKAFSLKDGLLSTSPTSQSSKTFSYPEPSPAVSSNGTSNGIVWAISISPNGEAMLSAYDATNLANMLYDSSQAPNNRDKADPYVRFTVPTVANGQVYFGTQDHLEVYGLLP
jgi:Bacterial Ig-like domain (group 2)